MNLFDSFMVRATFAGLGVAVAAAPLGCFVVWRRMAYFGDATAHAAILGVALALALNISVFAGVLLVALVMAIVVSNLNSHGHAMDTLLGVMAHSALAFGLVAVSFLSGARIDLMAYLFGDILAVGKTDLLVIWGGAALVVALIAWRWNALLTSTLSPDLAHSSGFNPDRERLVLTIALAIVIAVSIQVVGVLLIGSMLLIPAATAHRFSTTPERMAVFATLVACIATISGLYLAFAADTPAGPTIVSAAAFLFILSNLASFGYRKRP